MRTFRLASAVLGLVVALFAPDVADAKPWNGIQPGQSTVDDVMNRFGEPTTKAKRGNRTVLAYLGDQAPPGTKQAQFFLSDDATVAEITVFLAADLDKDAIEGTYGKTPEKTFTDEFLPVWVYRAAGITVYFGKEGRVEAITFAPGTKAAPRPATTTAPGAPASRSP